MKDLDELNFEILHSAQNDKKGFSTVSDCLDSRFHGNDRSSMRTKLLLSGIILLLVGFILGMGAAPRILPLSASNAPTSVQTATDESLVPSPKSQPVSLMLDFGDGTVKSWTDRPYVEGETLFDLTAKIVRENNLTIDFDPPGEYGIFLKSIGDKKGGEEGGKWWLWWANGKAGEVAADQYRLQPGDVTEWKFVNLKM